MKKETPTVIVIDDIKNEATLKAAEISKKIGKTVYPLVFLRPATQEVFVGFIQEPSRAAKMEAFDIMSSKESLSMAGEVILSTSILKEESHEAFYSSESKYDDVYLGGCVDSLGHISVLINSLKKK